MSLGDFEALTPDEFGEVCKSFREARETGEKGSWERMRILAAICIQPHVKSKVTPERLLPFPWEREKPKARPVSKEEDKRQLEKLMRKIQSPESFGSSP